MILFTATRVRRRKFRRGAGTEAHAQPSVCGVADECFEIEPADGIAARHHEQRRAAALDLFDESKRFLRVQFERVAAQVGRGAAVAAGEAARARHLPNHDERPVV